MKIQLLITLLFITNICWADQLDGVGYAVMAIGVLLLMFFVFVVSTVRNFVDIKRGKRHNVWLNIRAVITIVLSIIILYRVLTVEGIPIIQFISLGLAIITFINIRCLIKNNIK